MRKTKHDWPAIQKAYDTEQLTCKQIQERFGISSSVIYKASERGDFKTRSGSEAIKVSRKRGSEPHSAKTKAKIAEGVKLARLLKQFEDVPEDVDPMEYFFDIFVKNGILSTVERPPHIMFNSVRDWKQKRCWTILFDDHREDDKYSMMLESAGWRVLYVDWKNWTDLSPEERVKHFKHLTSPDLIPIGLR